MPEVVLVRAAGNEEVLVYPECPCAEWVSNDRKTVRCSLGTSYKYCTAMRMEPSLCPLDVPGNCFR